MSTSTLKIGGLHSIPLFDVSIYQFSNPKKDYYAESVGKLEKNTLFVILQIIKPNKIALSKLTYGDKIPDLYRIRILLPSGNIRWLSFAYSDLCYIKPLNGNQI